MAVTLIMLHLEGVGVVVTSIMLHLHGGGGGNDFNNVTSPRGWGWQ